MPHRDFDVVRVFVRNESQPYSLDKDKGSRLMEYLLKKDIQSFVEVTDITGQRFIIRTNEIIRVEPHYLQLPPAEIQKLIENHGSQEINKIESRGVL
jgi:hypothetical protein